MLYSNKIIRPPFFLLSVLTTYHLHLNTYDAYYIYLDIDLQLRVIRPLSYCTRLAVSPQFLLIHDSQFFKDFALVDLHITSDF